MNWQENLDLLSRLAGDSADESDPDFLAIINSCVLSAEDRILRDLDLLSTRVTDDTGKFTPDRRRFVLPTDTGTFIVLEEVRLIVNGVWGPSLLPVSRETINALWPSELAPTAPSYPTMWCPIDQASILVGPPPDQAYFASCFGTMRPLQLSARLPNGQPNTEGTFISNQLTDLFWAAEMLFISAYQRNWSAVSDDPQMGTNWEKTYERLLKSALVEEKRKMLQSSGFGSKLPSPIATPAQT